MLAKGCPRSKETPTKGSNACINRNNVANVVPADSQKLVKPVNSRFPNAGGAADGSEDKEEGRGGRRTEEK